MIATLSLPIDTALLAKLSAHVGNHEGVHDVREAINTAIAFWLAEQAPGIGAAEPALTHGFQWKALFLPQGTELRCLRDGDYDYARIVGDQIIHQGQIVSPNQFAQQNARSPRNAWADVYVRRPGDKHFICANRLRRALAEQPAAPAPAPQASQAAPAAQASQADPAGLLLAALLSHAAAASQPAAFPQAAQQRPPAPQRNTEPGPGWTLPERRTLRFRMEDVAY